MTHKCPDFRRARAQRGRALFAALLLAPVNRCSQRNIKLYIKRRPTRASSGRPQAGTNYNYGLCCRPQNYDQALPEQRNDDHHFTGLVPMVGEYISFGYFIWP